MNHDMTISATSPHPFQWFDPEGGLEAAVTLFSSPHSGRYYPPEMQAKARLKGDALRRSEDCLMDTLLTKVPAAGCPLMTATYPRAYVDLNRAADEFDPLLFRDPLPPWAASSSERVAAGLGVIARVVATGTPIYSQSLSLNEGLARIEQVYRPYHAALEAHLSAIRDRTGMALLVDCHSMPPLRANRRSADYHSSQIPDIVIGDRHGQSCDAALLDAVVHYLSARGLRVARNDPYAGGYCTSHYGRPEFGIHAFQIEVSRHLYLKADGLTPDRRGTAEMQDVMGGLAILLRRPDTLSMATAAE
jgi:N-formylglutamate amidohydrolase